MFSSSTISGFFSFIPHSLAIMGHASLTDEISLRLWVTLKISYNFGKKKSNGSFFVSFHHQLIKVLFDGTLLSIWESSKYDLESPTSYSLMACITRCVKNAFCSLQWYIPCGLNLAREGI